ncbi:MAG: 5-formyltetrahydrofolate cyclo-ligase [Alphaproteobacteria bacterium]|nr:5-formyltetrahydrofolate cyclo-ligase [Alphaproteobacteria bacterium]
MSDSIAAKRALRASALAARAACSAGDAAERAAGLALARIEFSSGAVVGGYWPMRGELDPRPLLGRLIERGLCASLCVIVGRGRPLAFRAWQPGDPLAPGPFGTSVPLPAAPLLTPDVVLTPLLAFDDAGYRLGYGGGYYDRTLAALKAARAVVAIGLAFEAQRVALLPHSAWDVPLDWIVTEARVRRPT